MDTKRLTIGQMAKLNHISEQTLRLYDKKGLLKPSYIDRNNGYRFYDICQSSRLDMIQTLQMYGMTLREIREHLKNGMEPSLKELLIEQKASIHHRIEELREVENQIAVHLDNMERYEILREISDYFLQYIPERQIYRYETNLDYFNACNSSTYELMLRELKRHMDRQGIPLSFFHNIGTVIKMDAIKSGNLSTREVFLLLNDSNRNVGTDAMPAGLYFCRCSNDLEGEVALARELLKKIDESGFDICGDYYCEVIYELPATLEKNRRIFYRMQIPVKKA